MVRSTFNRGPGEAKPAAPAQSARYVGSVNPPDDTIRLLKAQGILPPTGRVGGTTVEKATDNGNGIVIAGGDRPANFMYYMSARADYWYMYRYMDWVFSEVSVLSTIRLRTVSELFRYDLRFAPKFARKCETCGYEAENVVKTCPVCRGTRLRAPDASQKEYFRRPSRIPGEKGPSFLDEANDSHQSLCDVLRSYAESEIQNNQAYMICVTTDLIDGRDASLVRSIPMEFIAYDPKYVRYLYDDTGKPGTTFAFTRDERGILIDLNKDPNAFEEYDSRGRTLYPAAWQVGSNYGGTGMYKLYTEDEIYQDKWYKQSITYGVPIWYDIEDDVLTYHYLEKHQLKKYKYGFVRKIIVIPGLSDDNAEDFVKGIQDVLATNDNSIPIVALPPQLPGTAEIRAQTLELGTESEQDTLAAKDDIRNRLCAHGSVPNLIVGDVESSGGMNNESQQITIYDRYLTDKYNRIDRLCRWVLSWFPKITDWVLIVDRPGKAYSDAKRRMDQMAEAQGMTAMGFSAEWVDGRFIFSEKPIDAELKEAQIALQTLQTRMQVQQLMQMGPGAMMGGDPSAAAPPDGAEPTPGDEGGPVPEPAPEDEGVVSGGDPMPEKGTARREDGEIGAAADEVDQSRRENDSSKEV